MEAIRAISDEERKALAAISVAAFLTEAENGDFDVKRFENRTIDYSDPTYVMYVRRQQEIIKKTSKHLKICQIAGVIIEGDVWTIQTSRPNIVAGVRGNLIEQMERHVREYTGNENIRIKTVEVYDAVYDALAAQERLFSSFSFGDEYIEIDPADFE